MNHFVISVFCLIIGFMLGIGCMFSSTQMIVSLQNRRVAALTDSYYKLERLSVEKERHCIEKLQAPRKRKR